MADEAVFQEAVDALRDGNKAKARELLTGLLKTDQNNATYWIWLSAAMETPKERIYCLQTAFKLDPENVTAKRGLILLGALPADDSIQPFPVNRPRAWEERLLLAHEKPKPKGWAAVKASPVFRLGLVVLLVAAVVGGVTFGFIIPNSNRVARAATWTPGPSPTYTITVTAVGAKPQTPVVGTPNPLTDLLQVPYTPTALYVQPQRSPLTDDYYRQFVAAYGVKDWDKAIAALQEVLKMEPDTVYAYYYLGEAYRFKGDPISAQSNYGNAVAKDPNFGAGYVGLARARLLGDPNADVLGILNQAIDLDPNFGEAYIVRADVKIRNNDISGALTDLGKANQLMGDSALIYYELAKARFTNGELDLALTSAKRANELDVTLLPNYLLLGQIYNAMGDQKEAVNLIDTYIKYQPNDLAAFILLGEIEFKNGEYDATVKDMNQIIGANKNLREPYLYRFLSNVELGNGNLAEQDIDRVTSSYPDSFDVSIGVIRANLLQLHFGSAELALDHAQSLAETDEQKALVYYWSAITYEKRNKPKDALKNWSLLLDLPESASTAEMRKVANQHLTDLVTPTITPTVKKAIPSRTPSPTKTPKVTPTSKVTVTPTTNATKTPTTTPAPTQSPMPTPTK